MDQKQINFIKDIHEHATVFMDKNKLGRLVDNIISNAIKYNKMDGDIKVEVRQNFLRISDTGVGIPEDKIDTVFQRYQRANDVVGGFGIGLNIVALIAKEYKINLSIESKINEGTQITLKWPESKAD